MSRNNTVDPKVASAVNKTAKKRINAMREAAERDERWFPKIGGPGKDYQKTIPDKSHSF